MSYLLNVSPQMEYFEGIIPCGIADYPVIALAEIFPQAPKMETVKREVIQAFSEVFGAEIRPHKYLTFLTKISTLIR